MDTITFFVPGEPVEKGSTKSFYIKKLNRVVTTATNKKTSPWEGFVALCATNAGAGKFKEDDTHIGYKVHAIFYKTRPKTMPKKYKLALTRPDLDKYVRAINDGLTGILWSDDSHVISIKTDKCFTEDNYNAFNHHQPGVLITVTKVRDGIEEK
jgi:Holliday junction resolvase RusA-like endonuclease